MNAVTEGMILTHLVASVLAGGLIGLEREWSRKPAGLRTHALMAMVGCMFVHLAWQFYLRLTPIAGHPPMQFDPSRILHAGAQFIGGVAIGVIFKTGTGKEVFNMTTAVSLAAAFVVGMWISLGMWVVVMGATLLVFLVNLSGYIEKRAERAHDQPSRQS